MRNWKSICVFSVGDGALLPDYDVRQLDRLYNLNKKEDSPLLVSERSGAGDVDRDAPVDVLDSSAVRLLAMLSHSAKEDPGNKGTMLVRQEPEDKYGLIYDLSCNRSMGGSDRQGPPFSCQIVTTS